MKERILFKGIGLFIFGLVLTFHVACQGPVEGIGFEEVEFSDDLSQPDNSEPAPESDPNGDDDSDPGEESAPGFVGTIPVIVTPGYGDTDKDDDGIDDWKDNCPEVFNPKQLDKDDDGLGNACDNCPFWAYEGEGGRFNPDQTDSDGDKVGDICDNCKLKYNPTQDDSDNNSVGDHCENVQRIDPDDDDGDGVDNEDDNCPDTHNPKQRDTYGNPNKGDACEEYDVSTEASEAPWPWSIFF